MPGIFRYVLKSHITGGIVRPIVGFIDFLIAIESIFRYINISSYVLYQIYQFVKYQSLARFIISPSRSQSECALELSLKYR